MINLTIRKRLRQRWGKQVWFNQRLAPYTTFKIGGPAEVFIRPSDLKALREILRFLKQHKIKPFILGNGSNVLVKDAGFRGAIIQLSRGQFCRIRQEQDTLYVGAGVKIARLLRYCQDHGWGGVEFLAGIPATIGGALVMNAGGTANQMADVVHSVEVLDDGANPRELNKNEIGFVYRGSRLDNYVVIAARLNLKPRAPAAVRQQIRERIIQKKQTQDLSYPSAGCVFKNPPRVCAGYLMDKIGLKGRCCGDAAVSLKHANFIVNKGRATAADVLRLVRDIQRKIYQKFNLRLQREITVIGK